MPPVRKKPLKLSVWDYAIFLLGRRDYFSQEIAEKMRGRLVPEPDISKTLARLGEAGLVDDRALLRAKIQNLDLRPRGAGKLRWEFRRKGVPPELFDEIWAEVAPDETALARTAAEKKLPAVAREPDPHRRRDKMARFLASRGFAPGVCFEVAAEFCP